MSFGGLCAGIEFSRRPLMWLPAVGTPSIEEREEGAPLFAEKALELCADVLLSKSAAAKISADATTLRSEEV